MTNCPCETCQDLRRRAGARTLGLPATERSDRERHRPTLQYDYRRPVSPSRVFKDAIPFSRVRSRRNRRYAVELDGWQSEFQPELDLQHILNDIFPDEFSGGQGGWTNAERRTWERRLSKKQRHKYQVLRAIANCKRAGYTMKQLESGLKITEHQLRKYSAELIRMLGSKSFLSAA